ncbi:MAG: 4-phosphoerythronate dehydrogenase, partial [Bacteroidales bacterium]|nr:4-phosphoerythronate dehydrogenase [Bacteroidales bacterium]
PGNEIGQADIRDADALIIRTRTRCTRDLLGNSSVKFIATATIGYDHIDTNFCDSAGIAWTNAPGCNSSSVEQYIVSALLHLAVRRRFQPKEKTVGIVGVGNVGSKVERAAKALGCRVLLNDPPREATEGKGAFTELATLLKQADIVTMHVPLIGSGAYKTEAMADAKFYGQMKKGAVFINTSRGEVVDEGALKDAIASGKIADAVLDVYRNEPDIDRELVGMLAIATPHIAGYSTDGKANGTTMSVRAVSRFFGLGLDDWEPVGLPLPDDKEIFVDGEDAEELEIIRDAHGKTYRILDDHEALVAGPDTFEALRGGYRIRREPSVYSVKVFNDDGKYRKIFEGLGFNVIGDSCF